MLPCLYSLVGYFPCVSATPPLNLFPCSIVPPKVHVLYFLKFCLFSTEFLKWTLLLLFISFSCSPPFYLLTIQVSLWNPFLLASLISCLQQNKITEIKFLLSCEIWFCWIHFFPHFYTDSFEPTLSIQIIF